MRVTCGCGTEMENHTKEEGFWWCPECYRTTKVEI